MNFYKHKSESNSCLKRNTLRLSKNCFEVPDEIEEDQEEDAIPEEGLDSDLPTASSNLKRYNSKILTNQPKFGRNSGMALRTEENEFSVTNPLIPKTVEMKKPMFGKTLQTSLFSHHKNRNGYLRGEILRKQYSQIENISLNNKIVEEDPFENVEKDYGILVFQTF